MKKYKFDATNLAGRGITEDGGIAHFMFQDEAGDTLTIQMTSDLAAHFVSQCQATFVAHQTQKVAGKASQSIRQGDYLGMSLRHLMSVSAEPALVRMPPVVHLQLDRGRPDELNYSLEPDEADLLAEKLRVAASAVREDRKGQGQ